MGFVRQGFVGSNVGGDGSGVTDPDAFRDVLGVAPLPWEVSGCLAAWDFESVSLASGKVAQWNDRTGNGKHLTQANTALQGLWTNTGVQLVAGGAGYAITGGVPFNHQSQTVIWIGRTYTGSQAFGGQGGMLFRVASNASGVYFGEYNSFEYGRGGGAYVTPLCTAPNGSPSFYAVAYGSSESLYFNNGGRFSGGTNTAGTGTLVNMFATESAGSAMGHPTIAALIFDRQLTEAEITRIVRYYGAEGAAQRPRLIVTGSSTPAGYLASNYQAAVIPKLANKLGWLMSAGGVNGTSMATVAGIAQAAMVPTPGQPNRWLLFLTSNDIAAATGATATYQTNVTTHLTRIRAANPTGIIIVVDMPPRKGTLAGGQTEGGYETDRQTINTWANTNKATLGIDILVSFNDNTNIGQQSDVDNTTYYNADKIHLTDAGHTELANLIAWRILQYPA